MSAATLDFLCRPDSAISSSSTAPDRLVVQHTGLLPDTTTASRYTVQGWPIRGRFPLRGHPETSDGPGSTQREAMSLQSQALWAVSGGDPRMRCFPSLSDCNQLLERFAVSSARSIMSGVVQGIRMPASCSACAIFSGVWPPTGTNDACQRAFPVLKPADFPPQLPHNVKVTVSKI